MGMPDGSARGLPKSVDRSILTFFKSSAAWDGDTITLPTGLPSNAVLFIGFGTDSRNPQFNFGATQDSDIISVRLCAQETNDQCAYLYMVTLVPGRTWPSALNHNSTVTQFESMTCVAFIPSKGFRQRCQYNDRYAPGSVSSFTVTPPANPGPLPGGICVAFHVEDAGGAGPHTPSTQAGWNFVHSGGLGVFAWRLLAPDFIETAPAFIQTSSRTDTWSGCLAYVV